MRKQYVYGSFFPAPGSQGTRLVLLMMKKGEIQFLTLSGSGCRSRSEVLTCTPVDADSNGEG